MSGSNNDAEIGLSLTVTTDKALAEVESFLTEARASFKKAKKTMAFDAEQGRYVRLAINLANIVERSARTRIHATEVETRLASKQLAKERSGATGNPYLDAENKANQRRAVWKLSKQAELQAQIEQAAKEAGDLEWMVTQEIERRKKAAIDEESRHRGEVMQADAAREIEFRRMVEAAREAGRRKAEAAEHNIRAAEYQEVWRQIAAEEAAREAQQRAETAEREAQQKAQAAAAIAAAEATAAHKTRIADAEYTAIWKAAEETRAREEAAAVASADLKHRLAEAAYNDIWRQAEAERALAEAEKQRHREEAIKFHTGSVQDLRRQKETLPVIESKAAASEYARLQRETQSLLHDMLSPKATVQEKNEKAAIAEVKKRTAELEKEAKKRASIWNKINKRGGALLTKFVSAGGAAFGGARRFALGGLGMAKAMGLRSFGAQLNQGVVSATAAMGRFLGTTLRTGQAVNSVWLGLNKWVGRIYMAQRMAWTLRGAFDAIAAPLRFITDVSSQFEEMKIQLTGLLNAEQGPGDHWAASFEAASAAIDHIALRAAELPGEAEDYNKAMKLASVGMAQHGITDSMDQADFVARFSGTMQGMGESGEQTAADLQSLMTATVTKRTRAFKLLSGFLKDDAGNSLGTTKAYKAATPEQRVQAIENALAKFDPMLAHYTHTMSAQIGTFKTHMQILTRGAGAKIFDKIVTGLEDLNKWLSKNADKIVIVGQRVFDMVERGGRAAADIAMRVMRPAYYFAKTIGVRLAGGSTKRNRDLRLNAMPGIDMASAVGRFGGAAAVFGGGGPFAALSQLIGFVDGLTKSAEGLRDFMGSITVIFRRLQTIGEAAGKFFYRVGAVFADMVKTFVGGLAKRIDEWTKPIVKAFGDAADWLEAFWGRNKGILSQLASTFGDLLGAVGGLLVRAVKDAASWLGDHMVQATMALEDVMWWVYDAAVSVYKTFQTIANDFSGFWHTLLVKAHLEEDIQQSPIKKRIDEERARLIASGVGGEAATEEAYRKANLESGDARGALSGLERTLAFIRANKEAADLLPIYLTGSPLTGRGDELRSEIVDTNPDDRVETWERRAIPSDVVAVFKAAKEAQGYLKELKGNWYGEDFKALFDTLGTSVSSIAGASGNSFITGDSVMGSVLKEAQAQVDEWSNTISKLRTESSVNRAQLPSSIPPSSDAYKRQLAAERAANAKGEAIQAEITKAGDAAIGWFSSVGAFFNNLFSFNLFDLLTGKGVKASIQASMDPPKGGGGTTFDFRGSRFNIEQKFAEGFDPDRIATAFSRDIGELAERRTQSNLTGMFGVR